MTSPRELREIGVGAARDAREPLAELVRTLDDEGERQALSAAVGLLYAAEVAELPDIPPALDDAMRLIATVLDDPHLHLEDRRTLSRAMAILHPARRELGRWALSDEPEESTAPFLLTSAQIKRSDPEGFDEDRRRADRRELEVELGLEGETTFFTGRSGDVSVGGVFIPTEEPMSVGTELLVAFVLPDGHRVQCEGQVAWVRAPRYRPGELPAGMGVRFESLNDEDRRAIEAFFEQNPPVDLGET